MTYTFSAPLLPPGVTVYLTQGKLEHRNPTTARRLKGFRRGKFQIMARARAF